ncbi:hypothetical protein GCM10023339_71850 [Alloalcanivorax gelatiniphagus]
MLNGPIIDSIASTNGISVSERGTACVPAAVTPAITPPADGAHGDGSSGRAGGAAGGT